MAFCSLGAVILFLWLGLGAAQRLRYDHQAFTRGSGRRQESSSIALESNLVVDLGYERYQGVANASSGLNTWLGWVIAETEVPSAANPEPEFAMQLPQLDH